MKEYLSRSVFLNTDEDKELRVDYYIIESGSMMFGVLLRKFEKDNNSYKFVEANSILNITYSREEIVRICKILSFETVFPITLLDTLTDIDIYHGRKMCSNKDF